MRLKLSEKIKNCSLYFAFTFFIPLVVLCGLRLTGLCASSGGQSYVTTFPLPYGGDSGFGYGDYPLTSSIAAGALDFALSEYNYQFNLVTIYEVASDNSYIDFIVYVNEGSNFHLLNVSDYPNFDSSGMLIRNLDSYGSVLVRYNGAYSLLQEYSYRQYYDVSINNWLSSLPTGGFYLPQGTELYNYPVYYSGGTISGSEGDIFEVSTGSGDIVIGGHTIGGSGSGQFIHSSESPSTITGFDFDINLTVDDTEINSRLDTIDDSINGLGDKIDTSNGFLGGIYQGLTNFFSVPTTDTVTSLISSYPVIYDTLGTYAVTKSTINDLFDFTSISPKTASTVDFDYNFTWKVYDPNTGSFINKSTPVHIVFSWYESIRTPVTLVLTVFLVLGFVVYIFRQIPNLINGVSGGASAGVSVSEQFTSRKDNKK